MEGRSVVAKKELSWEALPLCTLGAFKRSAPNVKLETNPQVW